VPGFFKRTGAVGVIVAVIAAVAGWLAALVSIHGFTVAAPPLVAQSVPAATWVVIAAGAFGAYVLMCVRPLVAVFATLALMAVVIFVSRAAIPGAGIWFGWNILFTEFVVAAMSSVFVSAVRAARENRQLALTLEKYFPPARAKQFTGLRYRNLFAPVTERRPLTMLFASGNAACEKRAKDCVHATTGTVARVEATSLFAFWNAPELQADHATRACKAALRLRERVPVLRISIHTGVATVGNMGTAQNIDYAATDDSVEFTKRLADLNELLGTRVLVSSETRRVMSDQFVTRYLGNFRLQNFVDSMAIYELMGGDEVDEMGRALRDSFDQAVYAYQGSDLADAESSFRRVLEVYPDDLPSKFYLKRIEDRAGEPVPYDWDGVVDLNESSG
jgi:hypothetical protein